MKTTIGSGVVVAALVITGCDSSGELIHRETLAQVHEYGVTECPQDLGTIEVELGAGASAPVTLWVTEDIPSIDVLEPEIGWPIVDVWSITLEPGQVLVFPVQFNCGATEDVSGSIDLETTPRGSVATLATASIPVTLDIQGAP